ncbi:MAG: hypothetical protein O2958_10215 [Gemmatimonadetes bacterium]|nr:hypothetical protein [Gemmatimonadota bacterium]MDA1103372.1 hypothetical protein [Gemmatimonadota bacterium]
MSEPTQSVDARDQVLHALRALGGEATLGDLLTLTGLSRAELDASIDQLMATGVGQVRVLEGGDLTYRATGVPSEAVQKRRTGERIPERKPDRALARARQIVFDRRTLRLIRAREGVISLAELIEQTGLPLAEAEVEMQRLVSYYGGEPHSGLDGHVVYAFPELMTSVLGRFDPREPRPAWVRSDDPMDHSRRSRRWAKAGVAAVGAGGVMVASVPLLLSVAVGSAAVAVLAAGVVLVAGGSLAVVRNHRHFRFRQVKTLRRYALGYVVETSLAGKGVVSLDRTVRFIQGRAGKQTVNRGVVEAALRDLARDFDAPITLQGGDVFFGFRNVKRQFLASHLVRRSLHLGHMVDGRAVYDSEDTPLAAFDRELSSYSRPDSIFQNPIPPG